MGESHIIMPWNGPTLFWFARFKGKRTAGKILSSLFAIVNRSYVVAFYNNNCSYN